MGFGSYKTAWARLHRFRRAMIRPNKDRLNGIIEINETQLGDEEEGSRGRKRVKNALVVVAVEVDKKSLGEFASGAFLTLRQKVCSLLSFSHHFGRYTCDN